ncbi:MAG: rRNA maturation RNase YbeY [Candidatus Fervidibacterota bacterium]
MGSCVSLTVVKIVKRPLPKGLNRRLKRAVEIVLKGEGWTTPSAISIVLCDDETIHDLNRQFLRHDYPTDVLSFVLGETLADDGSIRWHGEIIISVDTAARHAHRFRHPLERELLHLAIHGTLHLLGYNDATPQQRRRMRRKELAYLKQLDDLTD